MTTNQIPVPPPFEHLQDSSHLIELRKAVASILSNRVLTNFTDHSITHSDQITRNIDELIRPLQASAHRLSETELTILYAGSYLHDIGMHYENAGDTNIIKSLKLNRDWVELESTERKNLLREHHHIISVEMIMGSVRAEKPLVGLQLTDQYKPELIAALSEAQNLPVDSDRYKELTQDVSGIRMRLLSGLLRIADILEESRRRATPAQAQTLLLDLTSQTHWWRHYYVSEVTFDQNHRLVTVWFDFPTEQRAEYNKIIPQLQMPWIENEFRYHAPIFHQYGFGWSVTYTEQQTPYSSAEKMPDTVLSEMWKQISKQRQYEDDQRKEESLQHFRDSMPSFDRRITEVENRKDSITKGEYIKEIAEISSDLWEIGAKRSASELLGKVYKDEILNSLTPLEQIKIAVQMAKMFKEQGDPRRAAPILNKHLQTIDGISDNQDIKLIFWKLYAEVLCILCDYNQATEAYKKAVENAPHEESRNELEAQISEMQLLFGDLTNLI